MNKRKLLQLVMWVRDFFRKNFHSKNEDLPYYVTILVSAILFILAMNAFVELTDELAENELEGVDRTVSEFIISFRADWLTNYFTFVTHLGDRLAYIIFTILLSIFYIVRHRSWKFILQTSLVLILATLSNIALKQVVNRSRPTIEHLVYVNTLSYPSGHSMSAMAFYGFLIYLSLRNRMPQGLRYLLVTLLTLLILSIGISRVYLGVHFPSDVAAGFVGGFIWVTFCAILFSLIDLMRKRSKTEK